jgi:hypothetical protein
MGEHYKLAMIAGGRSGQWMTYPVHDVCVTLVTTADFI